MERCLGLDLGEKRIGVSLSDALGWTAGPLAAVARVGWKKDMAALRSLILEHQVQRVVVGLPIKMDGTSGEMARRTQEFVERFRLTVSIPVETWDERLTTVQAERILVEADMRRDKRRQVIDSMAACLILQGYLDYRNAGGSPR